MGLVQIFNKSTALALAHDIPPRPNGRRLHKAGYMIMMELPFRGKKAYEREIARQPRLASQSDPGIEKPLSYIIYVILQCQLGLVRASLTLSLPRFDQPSTLHPHISRCSGTILRKTPASITMRTLLMVHSSIFVSVSMV